jgi:hypothetical protein
MNAMFGSGFEHTGTVSGTSVDNMFLYLGVFVGVRYEFEWES